MGRGLPFESVHRTILSSLSLLGLVILDRVHISSDLPISVFWKEIPLLVEHWVSSGRAAETSGRMQVGAVRSFSTQRKVRTDDALKSWASWRYIMSSERLDGPMKRPDSLLCREDSACWACICLDDKATSSRRSSVFEKNSESFTDKDWEDSLQPSRR